MEVNVAVEALLHVKFVPPTEIDTVPAMLLAPEVVIFMAVIVPVIPDVDKLRVVAGFEAEPNC